MNYRFFRFILALLLAATMMACSPMRYSQYSGSRQFWPVVQEALAETSFSLPVYRSWPDKPYEIIGSVRFENPNQYWDDGVISDAVGAAKSKGGNAIIIRYGSEFGVGGNIGAAEDPSVWSQNQITALVIRWKSQSAQEAEAAALRRFKETFRSGHPELSKNGTLLDSAIEYLQWQGLSLDSGAAATKLAEILEEMQKSGAGEYNGKWLYRCQVRRSRLTSSFGDSFYGIALVTLKEGVFTVVSTQGPAEVTFSGNFDNGRLTGKMGIGTASINCDGVGSKEKVSLSGHGQVADGTIQASLIFLR
jgi:hypothetical protein